MFFISKQHKLTHPEILVSYTLPTILVFIALSAVTFLSWRSSRQSVQAEIDQAVTRNITETKTDIQTRFSSYEQILLGGVGYLATTNQANAHSWREFLNTFDIPNKYPGIQGVGYSQAIKPSELAAHLEAMRTTKPDYDIFPSGNRDTYTSIIFLEPASDKNQKVIGYDMFSEPVRRAAMERARDTGSISVTKRTQLVQDKDQSTNNVPGFLIYAPLYNGSQIKSSVEERQANLRGYVYAPFRAESIFGVLLPKNAEHEAFRVYSDSKLNDAQLLYETGNFDSVHKHAVTAQNTSFPIGQTNWLIEYVADNGIISSSIKNRPLIVILRGGVISLFVALFVLSLLINRHRAAAYAEEREIQRAKDELLSLASHQLRTPATGVKQYVGMVLEGFMGRITPKQQEMLKKAYESNERQLEIINQLLYVARLDTGRVTIHPKPVAIKALIKDIIQEQQASIKARDQHIRTAYPKQEIKVQVDPQYFRMALENLMTMENQA
jgi:CHASE1-domain containing sensor protein